MSLTFRSPSADPVSQGSQPPPFITGVNMIPAKRWGPARDPPQEKIMEPAHETLRYSGRSMPQVRTAADEKRTAIDAVLDRTMSQCFPESGTRWRIALEEDPRRQLWVDQETSMQLDLEMIGSIQDQIDLYHLEMAPRIER